LGYAVSEKNSASATSTHMNTRYQSGNPGTTTRKSPCQDRDVSHYPDQCRSISVSAYQTISFYIFY
jgi:hypothetical protein